MKEGCGMYMVGITCGDIDAITGEPYLCQDCAIERRKSKRSGTGDRK